MKIVKEFSRFAYEYDTYNVIQKEVAKKLMSYVEDKMYNRILDLGAGDGAIYKYLVEHNIAFKEFIAFDFSQEMLNLHPTNENVTKICMDFNQTHFLSTFENMQIDLLLSSSALQWSENLSLLLSSISKLSSSLYFSFFTSNTFKTLHKTANIESPIYTKKEIIDTLNRIFIYELETIEYRLDFDSVYEMLRYIKHSGVSGGVNQLSFKEMKRLIKEYPLDYLEFEVIFVKVKRVI